MKPELQEKVFSWVSETAQSIGDWTAREVPAFITEYLTWKFWENMLGIGVFIFGLLLGIGLLLMIYKFAFKPIYEVEKKDNDIFFTPIFGGIISIVAVVLFANTFPYQNIVTCVKIKVAPKVYLIEEAARIIKSK